MILTTTPTIEGRQVKDYLGIVNGEAILGANVFKDIFASITDIVGGRSTSYEAELAKARELAQDEMVAGAHEQGADAIVGIDIDYEVIDRGGSSMLMVSFSGTAVKLS